MVKEPTFFMMVESM